MGFMSVTLMADFIFGHNSHSITGAMTEKNGHNPHNCSMDYVRGNYDTAPSIVPMFIKHFSDKIRIITNYENSRFGRESNLNMVQGKKLNN